MTLLQSGPVQGLWTPALTFATAGDQNIVLSTAAGFYTVNAKLVTLFFNIVSSTFTHTTASGALQMTGFPFAAENTANLDFRTGNLQWRGITKANFTDLAIRIQGGASLATFIISGSGQTAATVSTGDVPSGGTVQLVGFAVYRRA